MKTLYHILQRVLESVTYDVQYLNMIQILRSRGKADVLTF